MNTLQSLANESLDMIIAFDVISTSQRRVANIFRSGVAFYVKAVNGLSTRPMVNRRLAERCYWDLPMSGFYRASITQLLKSSGFSKVACHEDAPFPGFKSAVRWGLWKIIRAYCVFAG